MNEQERRELIRELKEIKSVIDSAPLEQALPSEAKDKLESIVKNMWNSRISAAKKTALLITPGTQIGDLMSMLEFDSLRNMEFAELTAATNKLIKTAETQLEQYRISLAKTDGDKTRMQELIRNQESFLHALRGGEYAMRPLTDLVNDVITAKTSNQDTNAQVFVAAGAFLSGLCATLFAPLTFAKYTRRYMQREFIGIGDMSVMEPIESFPEDFKQGPLTALAMIAIDVIFIAPIAVSIWLISSCVSGLQKTAENVYDTVRGGVKDVKKSRNDEYRYKTELIDRIDAYKYLDQELYKEGEPSMLTQVFGALDRTMGMLSRTQQKTPAIFELQPESITILKALDPSLAFDLKTHFKARYKQIDSALSEAIQKKDETSANEISSALSKLEKDWGSLTQPLLDRDKVSFLKAVDNYLTAALAEVQELKTHNLTSEKPYRYAKSGLMFQRGMKSLVQEEQELTTLKSKISRIR